MELIFVEVGGCDGDGDAFECDSDVGHYWIGKPVNQHINSMHPERDPIKDPTDTRRKWGFYNDCGDTVESEPISNDIEVMKAICREHYNQTVAKIASANGYVKSFPTQAIRPGKVVLDLDVAKELLGCVDSGRTPQHLEDGEEPTYTWADVMHLKLTEAIDNATPSTCSFKTHRIIEVDFCGTVKVPVDKVRYMDEGCLRIRAVDMVPATTPTPVTPTAPDSQEDTCPDFAPDTSGYYCPKVKASCGLGHGCRRF